MTDDDGETGRMDRRRSHPRADALGAADEPSRRRQGRAHRSGRADERGRGERAAEDARGAAGRHVSASSSRIRPGRLPATIRSRCQHRRAPYPTTRQGVEWLAAQGVRDAASLLAQAGGAPLAALALADGDYQAERAVWMKALAAPRRVAAWRRWAARIDAGPREGAQGSPRRRHRLARWLVRRPRARRTPAGRRVATRITARRSRRSRRRWRRSRCFAIIAALLRPTRAARAPAAAAPRRRGATDRLPGPVPLTMAEKDPCSNRGAVRPSRRAVAQHPREGGALRGVHAVPARAAASSFRRRGRTRSARKCSCCCR